MGKVLARAGDGQWRPLEQVSELPEGGLASICGDDLASIIDSDVPLPVAAVRPDVAGAPDAVCVSPDGDITLVVSFFSADPADSFFRLLECAGALTGMTYERFRDLCNRVGDAPLAEWAARDGQRRDPAGFAAGVEARLKVGEFRLLAVAPDGSSRIAGPIRYLNGAGADIDLWELSIARAGDVQTVEATRVDVAASPRHDHHAESADADGHGHDHEAPATAWDEPGDRWNVTYEPAPEPDEAGWDEPEQLQDEPQEDDPRANPTAVDFMHEAGNAAGATVGLLVAQLVEYGDRLASHVSYDWVDGSPVMRWYVDRHGERPLLLEVNAWGSIGLELRTLDEHARGELVKDLGRVLGWDVGDIASLSRQELSIADHLNDETLMQVFGEALADALGTTLDDSGDEGAAAGEFDGDFFSADDARVSNAPSGMIGGGHH